MRARRPGHQYHPVATGRGIGLLRTHRCGQCGGCARQRHRTGRPSEPMKRRLATKKTLVCVGPGGVGKTTTAASLGVIGARNGLRTLVCTIDPAPRLADALGVANLGPTPTAIGADTAASLGITSPHMLHAMRVDPATAFAHLVEDQVADPELRRHIFSNSLYRHVTTNLT